MKRFHIGVLASEVVQILPSKDSAHPTKYMLRNGNVALTSGDWRDNVIQVESILNAQEANKGNLEAEERRLRYAKEELERTEKELNRIKNDLNKAQLIRPSDDAQTIFLKWRSCGKNYLTVEQRDALAKALGLGDA